MKDAVNSGATSKNEPVKYNMTFNEIKKMMDLVGDGSNGPITLMLTKTSIGSITEISVDYDGEFEDITDYDSF
jgi:hypothetical protein